MHAGKKGFHYFRKILPLPYSVKTPNKTGTYATARPGVR
jgi:hypothetical protein